MHPFVVRNEHIGDGDIVQQLLNSCQWKVKGHWPYVPFLGKSMELKQDLMGVTDWMDATVPGGVHMDLYRNGMIEHPMVGLNAWKCEWVESRWWQYKTSFPVNPEFRGKQLRLIFKGIDYKAHFYFNQTLLGSHEGMYTPAIFDITHLVRFDGENDLVVLLESPPDEMGQIGFTSRTHTQKARFNYKWDFSTRMVNIGIWDDVILDITGDTYIEETYIRPVCHHEDWSFKIDARICCKEARPSRVVFQVLDEEKTVGSVECTVDAWEDGYACCSGEIHIEKPKLWYPNGMGSQPLYTAKLEVFDAQGELSDMCIGKTGMRKLGYARNVGAGADALPYTVVVNGKAVYIKGVNITPFDLMYGNVTNEQYEDYILLLKKMNVNLVRVWGGGIIEKEAFYDLCDQYGIMVWQEFIQSSSGIDNVPSKHSRFLELLSQSARQAVKVKRNHICHTFWSGGNELTDENGAPATYADENIAILQQIVNELDPEKLFLPTSASGPREFLSIEEEHRGQNHDVHGPWKYAGEIDQYTLYNNADSMMHSEFGVDGCASYRSLKKFLEDKDLIVTNMQDNLVWRAHGEWWDTLDRDEKLFGKMSELELFTEVSQWTQAEGLRYAVEANRRRKYENSGSIVWQFNEPYPNVSCTSLVDYYKQPKMVYYWLKRAYAPRHLSMRYEKLVYNAGDIFTGKLYMNNSLQEVDFDWKLCVMSPEGSILLERLGSATAGKNSCVSVDELEFTIPPLGPEVFIVRVSYKEKGGEEWVHNVYLFGREDQGRLEGVLHREKVPLEWELIDSCRQGEDTCCRYKVSNPTDRPGLYVRACTEAAARVFFCGQNYETLMPHETAEFTILIRGAVGENMENSISFQCW